MHSEMIITIKGVPRDYDEVCAITAIINDIGLIQGEFSSQNQEIEDVQDHMTNQRLLIDMTDEGPIWITLNDGEPMPYTFDEDGIWSCAEFSSKILP